MALVQLASSEEAMAALVKLHNYQLSETSHLRYHYITTLAQRHLISGNIILPHRLNRWLCCSREAMAALVKLHDYQLSETSHLRYHYITTSAQKMALLQQGGSGRSR